MLAKGYRISASGNRINQVARIAARECQHRFDFDVLWIARGIVQK